MADYGYMRVSTTEQSEGRQQIAMEKAGVPTENIFLDKQSGKDFDRPEYQRLVRKLRAGDTLFVKSLDRFGRSYDDILWQWRFLTQKKDVAIVVLDMPLLDTRQDKDLMGKVISDIVLQLLSYVAQTEREFIRQRQREGIAAAKARGVRFGRRANPLPPEFEEAAERWRRGELTITQAAALSGLSRSTFWVKAGKKRRAGEDGN